MIGIMVPYGLKAGWGICKYPYPIVGCERGESRAYGYHFRPRDNRHLLYSRCIYINDGAGVDVNYNRAQPEMAFNVGPVLIDQFFGMNSGVHGCETGCVS
jgi:hypothetical protein